MPFRINQPFFPNLKHLHLPFSIAVAEFLNDTLGPQLCVFLCAMLPVIELRGAIPLGAALGLPLWQCFLFSVLGNMVPVPFVLLLVQKILAWMAGCRIGLFRRFAAFLYRKSEKNRKKIERFAFWGVCLFVAIPLPMTGAWTGSLVASSIGMKFLRAVLSAFIGVLIAGCIVSLICSGVIGFLDWML
mgnify:CR=1 FL=1